MFFLSRQSSSSITTLWGITISSLYPIVIVFAVRPTPITLLFGVLSTRGGGCSPRPLEKGLEGRSSQSISLLSVPPNYTSSGKLPPCGNLDSFRMRAMWPLYSLKMPKFWMNMTCGLIPPLVLYMAKPTWEKFTREMWNSWKVVKSGFSCQITRRLWEFRGFCSLFFCTYLAESHCLLLEEHTQWAAMDLTRLRAWGRASAARWTCSLFLS